MTSTLSVGSIDSGATAAFRQGTGSPVVLLHGVTMSWRAWRPVLPFLVGRHDVFAPTLPGHRGGPELVPGDQPGLAALVDEVERQLDDAGIDTAHLVGNSLGGWVALELARRGRAMSVVGLSPAGTWKARRDLIRLLFMFRMAHMALGSPQLGALARTGPLSRAAMKRTMERPGNIPRDELAEMLDDASECRMMAALLSGEARLELMHDFDVALCPVHIAWSGKDKVIPYGRYGRPMQDTVRGAEFSVLPGVGHVPMYDDPRLVARTILEMTTSVDATYRVIDEPARDSRNGRHARNARRARYESGARYERRRSA
ncbi:MAG TPA: alpha/beta fold hydrolase [Pseudonocardia sp.]